jgi:carbon storage regulator
MLVLTRQLNQSIKIGEDGDITIKVLDFDGHNVRLGIDAPKTVAVNREEIFNKKLVHPDFDDAS